MQEKRIFTIQWVIEEKDPHIPRSLCFVHVVKLNSSANLQFKRERRWVQTERRWVQTRGRSVGHRIFLECLNYNWIICIKSSLCRVMLLAYFIFFCTLLCLTLLLNSFKFLFFPLHFIWTRVVRNSTFVPASASCLHTSIRQLSWLIYVTISWMNNGWYPFGVGKSCILFHLYYTSCAVGFGASSSKQWLAS